LKKVLVTIPNPSTPGGVTSLFRHLNLNDHKSVTYFINASFNLPNNFVKSCNYLKVLLVFVIKCFSSDIIHLNPSFEQRSFIREWLFSAIAQILNKKVLIYWHGWNEEFEKNVVNSKLLKKMFHIGYIKADKHIVLGEIFKEKLISFGIQGDKIILETNSASEKHLYNKNELKKFKPFTAIFLSRIEEKKGVFIAIDAVRIASNRISVNLIIAGDGPDLSKAIKYANARNVKNIHFKGFLLNEAKDDILAKSHALLFPTFYGEGMPVCINEAMLYGLPILTRPMGGIKTWVKDNDNGFLSLTGDAKWFADKLIQLATDPILYQTISENNKRKAQELFIASKVRERIFSYYNSL
jgi:glycosyltransferase involved in cell wall biosynthesis